jgi:hypothetical protein
MNSGIAMNFTISRNLSCETVGVNSPFVWTGVQDFELCQSPPQPEAIVVCVIGIIITVRPAFGRHKA